MTGVFPYAVDNRFLCRHKELCKNSIAALISCGNVLENSDQLKRSEVISFDKITNGIKAIDRVFFVDCNTLTFDDYDKALKEFAKKGIEVILATGIYDEALKNNNSEYGLLVKRIHDLKLVPEISLEKAVTIEKKDIGVPIVGVVGTGYNVSKFDIQLYLREHFLKNKYKVSQIGSKKISELFGFHSMPDFMFNNCYSNQEKIFKFNEYVRVVSKIEKPDVIIIGVPEPVLPLNKKHPFNMGIIAFEILNAVDFDYLVLSLMHGEYTVEFMSEMERLFKYRFNTEIDDYYVSNFSIVSNSLYSRDLKYVYIDDTVVDTVNNIWHEKNLEYEDFFVHVEDQLKKYADYEQY